MKLSQYQLISPLFDYPNQGYRETMQQVADGLRADYPTASVELEELLKLLPTDVYEIQELYTKSFEVQAVTSLEIGYVLYGDDYTRGEVLSNLSAEHKAVANECGGELADHLANVLRLVPKIKDREILFDLMRLMVAPAVENMMKEYTPSSMRQKEKLYKKQYKTLIIPSVPLGMYLHLFKALYTLLDSDFELITENKPFEDVSFFGFLKNELEVEEGKKSSNSCSMKFDANGMPVSSCGV
jgi:nitrate reductase assembly molybdenum cofactor insertion protein NarJ